MSEISSTATSDAALHGSSAALAADPSRYVQKQMSTEGWKAGITLAFKARKLSAKAGEPVASTTTMYRSEYYGPLRVQRPFYPEPGACHVYLLHPPGGVVGGDRLQVSVTVEPQAHALITTPGATKFYRSAGKKALLSQSLHVHKDACLEWFPQENIFFPGAAVDCITDIHMHKGAQLFAWEITCLGRPTNAEVFDEGCLLARFNVYQDGKPILLETQRVSSVRHLNASAGLRNYPMQALFVASACTEVELELCRDIIEQQALADLPVALTLLDGLLVFRALGSSTEQLQKIMVPLWHALREKILHKKPITPRIWLT